MSNKIIFVLTIFLLLASLPLEAQVIQQYKMDGSPDRSGLVGNGITDLIARDSVLYVGTGYGLGISADGGESWQNFTDMDYRGKGGLSAMDIGDDGTIWIATAYDTATSEDETMSAGGGLRYRLAGSDEWVYVPQPKDARTDTTGGMSPTTTHISNLTFDIALLDSQIWIASFAGGIRRSTDMGKTWKIFTTDGNPFAPLHPVYGLNHRGFSTLAENGNIWVGTAQGVSKSEDDGETWQRFRVRGGVPESDGISGNWILSLEHNPWDNSVWAVAQTTEGSEFNSICRTKNGGLTWETYLADELNDGTFARAISFYDSVIYVATEKGLYKSPDNGDSWYTFPQITDKISGEQIFTTKFYSVATEPAAGNDHRLWTGTADGLAMSENSGYDWTVFRSFVSTRDRKNPSVYAYPNPFSPARGGVIRFQYDIAQATKIKIDIYNFAMEEVISLSEFEGTPLQNSNDRSSHWDGLDSNGRMVDNGVYFFRADIGGKKHWGKIVVIN